MKICGFCGKEYTGENKEFCSRECYILDKRIVLTCQYCKKTFSVPKNKSNRSFCSADCRRKALKDPSKRKLMHCKMCGKEFEAWVYRERKFCSRLCGNKNAARQPKPGLQKPDIHITKECVVCGSSYQTTTHQEILRGSSCCSVKCVAELNSRRMKREGNPNWKGGYVLPDHLIDYGSNWQRQRKKAQKRDGHRCQICGYKAWDSTIILDVHHIVPFRLFDGNWKEANKLSNLIVLCRSCHRKVEFGELEFPTGG